MRGCLYVLIGTLIGVSCSSIPYIRKFTERRYRPAQDFEDKDPVGKFAFRYCVRYKALRKRISANCSVWKTDIRNFCSEKDFYAFREAGFVLIQERRIE